MNPKTGRHLLAFLSLLVIFGLAFSFDRGAEALRAHTSRTLASPQLSFWFWATANLILAVLVLALYTWALPQLEKRAAGIILLVGLAVNFLPILAWTPFFTGFMFLTRLLSSRMFLANTGGLFAIAAAFRLFRPQPEQQVGEG